MSGARRGRLLGVNRRSSSNEVHVTRHERAVVAHHANGVTNGIPKVFLGCISGRLKETWSDPKKYQRLHVFLSDVFAFARGSLLTSRQCPTHSAFCFRIVRFFMKLCIGVAIRHPIWLSQIISFEPTPRLWSCACSPSFFVSRLAADHINVHVRPAPGSFAVPLGLSNGSGVAKARQPP